MASKIALDLFPMLRMYKDGHVERLAGTTDTVPPSLDDPKLNVQSKDVVYSPESNLSSRIYLPKSINPNQKLPLLVYFHGRGFCVGSAFHPLCHNFLNNLAAETNVIAVSVDYRLAPEHPLPIAYDDSWLSLRWVASHANRNGPEEWLNSYANLDKVFLAGDSAGGNIAYNMAMRYGREKLVGINLNRIALIHPYFMGKDPIGNETPERRALPKNVWFLASPTTSGLDDPWINPLADLNLPSLGCSKVLILVAEKDNLRDRGWLYYEELGTSGWSGNVEIMEAKGKDHLFHLFNPHSKNTKPMLSKIVSFLTEEGGDLEFSSKL